MNPVDLQLPGRVLRLDPRRRIATVSIPAVGRGRSYSAAYALPGDPPGQALASVTEHLHGDVHQRGVGTVTAVRPRDTGAEVDLHVSNDLAWEHLATGEARVAVHCSFTGAAGADPYGGAVTHVDLD